MKVKETKPTKPQPKPGERVCERCGTTKDNFLDVKAYYVPEGGMTPKRIFCDKCYMAYSKEVYEAHQI